MMLFSQQSITRGYYLYFSREILGFELREIWMLITDVKKKRFGFCFMV